MKNYFKSGSWNLTCDRCGKKIKTEEAKHEWTGFIVCGDCYEVRQPQDFVKAKTDKITVPFTRPIPSYVFTSVAYRIYVEDGYWDFDYVEDL